MPSLKRRPDPHTDPEAYWRQMLTVGHRRDRLAMLLFGLLPGSPRCKVCRSPFGGPLAPFLKLVGSGPSRKSPAFCNL